MFPILTPEGIEERFFARPPERIYRDVSAGDAAEDVPSDLSLWSLLDKRGADRLKELPARKRELLAAMLVPQRPGQDLLTEWLDGDPATRWRFLDGCLRMKLIRSGPEVTLARPIVRRYLDALWRRSHDPSRSMRSRNAARRRLQEIWTFPREDLRSEPPRPKSDAEQIAVRYDQALSDLKRRIQPERSRRTVLASLEAMFPKARGQDRLTLLAWWARTDDTKLRPALCQALSREVGLEASSIPEKVAEGRRSLRQRRERTHVLEEQRRRAWEGYDRLVAWCAKRQLDLPVTPPSGRRPPPPPP